MSSFSNDKTIDDEPLLALMWQPGGVLPDEEAEYLKYLAATGRDGVANKYPASLCGQFNDIVRLRACGMLRR
jgi:hypothetical protein